MSGRGSPEPPDRARSRRTAPQSIERLGLLDDQRAEPRPHIAPTRQGVDGPGTLPSPRRRSRWSWPTRPRYRLSPVVIAGVLAPLRTTLAQRSCNAPRNLAAKLAAMLLPRTGRRTFGCRRCGVKPPGSLSERPPHGFAASERRPCRVSSPAVRGCLGAARSARRP